MKNAPRYLLAKYISDLQRMEPRNIGIIVCAEGALSARFLGERSGAAGEIDGRRVPSFVTSLTAYKQWVEFWRGEIRRRDTKENKPQALIESLKNTSRGNFLLAEGGMVLDSVEPVRLSRLTDDLFQRLVNGAVSEEIRDPVLDQVVDNVIRELRLKEDQNFHTRYEVSCRVAPNVHERFEFSHAYANGNLKRLYQRVPLSRKRAPLRRTVHDSAWMFEKVVQSGIIEQDQAIALVYVTEEHKRDPEMNWSLDVLGSVARVANLAEQMQALSVFVVD